jgi:pyrimidine deaminase RibD-like protein
MSGSGARADAAGGAAPCYSWACVPVDVRGLFVHRIPHEEKIHFMRRAIAEARKSPFHPSVGAVIVRAGRVLSTGFRDSLLLDGTTRPPRTRSLHAEEVALLNAPEDLSGAALYTTLEPCVERSKPSFLIELDACSTRVLRSGIRTVVIGLIDQDVRMRGKGARHLAEHGVELESAYDGIERELVELVGNGRFWHAAPRPGGVRRLTRRLLKRVRRRKA